jgi:hypothetical protein
LDEVSGEYTEIAMMWQRGFVRCMLSGDGVTFRLTLVAAGQIVRCVARSDEQMILTMAHVLLGEHELQVGRANGRPR